MSKVKQVLLASLSLALVVGACSGDPSTYDRGQMLQNTADEVAMPLHEQLASQAETLQSDVEAFCSDVSESTLSSAQDSWKNLQSSLKKAESFSFGPFRQEFSVFMEVDKWPAYPDEVESEIEDFSATDKEPVTYVKEIDYTEHQKGLPAIEYLLWSSGESKSVPVRFQNADASRCNYLKAVATYSANQLKGLEEAWSSDGGNYVGEFANAGVDSDAFGTKQSAINKLVNTMIFVSEEMVQKMRFGDALGESNGGSVNVEALESRFSGTSKEQILSALEGLEAAYDGADGKTLSDFTNFKKPAVDKEVKNALDGAISAVEDISSPMREALENDKGSVQSAQEAVGELSRVLKTELATILGVTKTNIVADND